MTFGERLKALRKEKGLTQKQVITAGEISPATMSHIENDIITPSFKTLQRLSTGLNISIMQLLAYDDNMLPAEIAALDEIASKIIATYNHLSAKDKHALLRYAEFLNMEQAECPPSNNGNR